MMKQEKNSPWLGLALGLKIERRIWPENWPSLSHLISSGKPNQSEPKKISSWKLKTKKKKKNISSCQNVGISLARINGSRPHRAMLLTNLCHTFVFSFFLYLVLFLFHICILFLSVFRFISISHLCSLSFRIMFYISLLFLFLHCVLFLLYISLLFIFLHCVLSIFYNCLYFFLYWVLFIITISKYLSLLSFCL
jgi:hypothetical protein